MLPILVRVGEFLTAWYPLLLLACMLLDLVVTKATAQPAPFSQADRPAWAEVPIVVAFAERSGWNSPSVRREHMAPGWLSARLTGRRRKNTYIVTYRESNGRPHRARCVVTEHDRVVVLSDDVVPDVQIW